MIDFSPFAFGEPLPDARTPCDFAFFSVALDLAPTLDLPLALDQGPALAASRDEGRFLVHIVSAFL